MSCVLFGKVGGGTAAPGLEGGERLLGGCLGTQAAPHGQQGLPLPQTKVGRLATCTHEEK